MTYYSRAIDLGAWFALGPPAAGSTWADQTANGHDATLTGVTFASGGGPGPGLPDRYIFDGIDDHGQIAHAENFNRNGKDTTLVAWFKPNFSAGTAFYDNIMAKGSANDAYGLRTWDNDRTRVQHLWGNVTPGPTGILQDNVWHMVAVRGQGTTSGVLIRRVGQETWTNGGSTGTEEPVNNAHPFYIGARGTGGAAERRAPGDYTGVTGINAYLTTGQLDQLFDEAMGVEPDPPAPSDWTSYVEFSIDAQATGAWVFDGIQSTTNLFLSDTVTADTLYRYRVRTAFNTEPAGSPPGGISATKTGATNNYISWNSVTNAIGYEIERQRWVD